MKRTLTATAGAALLALAAGITPSLRGSPLDFARREAAPRGALVVADFYTEWCGWCRVLDRSVYPDPLVRRQLDRAVFVRLDAEREGEEDARRYRVDGFPTIVFLEPGGREVGRIVGFYPAPIFAERARAILDSRR
ncbi:MAG TPA: thioredoxin fold domain-containing protein [Thermoanaerobaculia bacterium]|nr:thioredoxin fold domain-containing protein [Thermoanaerobaculia bacterium]